MTFLHARDSTPKQNKRQRTKTMIKVTQQEGGEFKPLDAGTYIARCVSIWSIGTQYNKWNDNWKPQVILQWEIPEELTDDGAPKTICAFFTLSLHAKSNLYKSLTAWRGKPFTSEELAGFDLEKILGAPCLLSIEHTTDGKQKVSSVAKLGKGMVCPDAHHDLTTYEASDDAEGKKFASLPEWVQNIVDASRERMPIEGEESANSPEPAATTDSDGDDIPF